MFACIIFLTALIIVPVNRFIPAVGAIDAPDFVLFLELGFLLLASAGVTGLFLRWIGRQTGTLRQYVLLLFVLLALIALEVGIFTFVGAFMHAAIKDHTSSTSALSSKGIPSEER